MIKIISWNINSIRLRLPLLEQLVLEENPDIICLQETKVADIDFPAQDILNLGFKFTEFSGQKSYNGVAICSKIPLLQVNKYQIVANDKRHISATLENGLIIHNFYVPAGGEIADVNLNDKFASKLQFLDWMVQFFNQNHHQASKIVMLGDINVAPLINDVWSHQQMLKVISHTPIEVDKMNQLKASLNWLDAHRFFVGEEPKVYSWWSYRGLEPFKSNRGRKLDHIWLTPNLQNNLQKAEIFKDFRLRNRPSDHAPIAIELNF